jgi:diguanylate cyclase (GGDEF)-like protein/PAS domain S-box-containing protein
VSRRVRRAPEEELFRTAFENAPIGMAIGDLDGRFLEVNGALCRFLGYSHDALLQMGFQEITLPADLEIDLELFQRLASGEIPTYQFEKRYIHADGAVLTALLNVSMVRDAQGRPERYLAQIKDITQRKQAQLEADNYRDQLELAQELSALGSYTVDPQSGRTTWSAGLYRVAARDPSLPALSIQDIFERLVHPDDREPLDARLRLTFAGDGTFDERFRIIREDGEIRTVYARARMVDTEHEGRLLVGVLQDVTDRLVSQAARQQAESRFSAVFESAPIGVCLTALGGDEHGAVLQANPALADLTGRSTWALERALLTSLVHSDDRAALASALQRLRDGAGQIQLEVRVCRADGEEAWARVSATPVEADGAAPLHAVTQVVDISERKALERRLQHMADHDPLTGLYNRRRFDRELTTALAHADRDDSIGAMLIIDLDTFKDVNDSFGRSAGDNLLSRVAFEFQKTLDETHVVARLGGDEFAVLLPQADETEAATVARRLLDAIADVTLPVGDDRLARITASVGIATFGPRSGLTGDDLIAEADLAMHDAKDAGRSGFRVFRVDDQRRMRITKRPRWLTRLRDALEHDRFRLLAQPIVGICAAGVARAELLLRYRDDDGELIPPSDFLYLAERYGIVRDIDRWVMEQAVGILHREYHAEHPCVLSINVSGRTLVDEGIIDELAEMLAARPIPPKSLIVEVTETAAITNIARAQDFAERLHELGCCFALDDFGAGFASFYYLKHLRFDEIKIDGEFIRNLPESRIDQLIVDAVVRIAKGLGATTVGEFVASDEAIEALRRLGVDYGQGFGIGPPVPVEEFLHVTA